MLRSDMHITIALCTYNGQRHLSDQLQSYLAQTHRNWSLWVSDDGSDDGTRAILEAFRRDHGQDHDIRIIDGPGQGAAANFLSLLSHPDFPRGYTALSDQDDVWLRGRLRRGLSWLMREARGAPGKPLLYGAQSFHVKDDLKVVSASRTGRARPSFCNALVQNVISGHSAMLCPRALDLVRRAGVPQDVPFHDWWIYLLVMGAGGRAVVDPRQVVLYRQHDTNMMGANRSTSAWIDRAALVLRNEYARWTTMNIAALSRLGDLLTTEARETLERFAAAPWRWGPGRVAMLRGLGLHRQSRVGTASLYLAGFLGRI